MYLRYAQEYGGQRLHLVEEHTDGSVSLRAQKCLKVADRVKETLPTVGLYIDVTAGV